VPKLAGQAVAPNLLHRVDDLLCKYRGVANRDNDDAGLNTVQIQTGNRVRYGPTELTVE
jgi:hypothetical protein